MEHAAIIDIRTPEEICLNIKKTGLHVLKIPQTDRTAAPLSGHPDIQLFLHENNAFVHPHIDKIFCRKLEKFCNIIWCTTELRDEYPGDVAYNIASTSGFAIHRHDCTEHSIKNYLENRGLELINARQGYSKCSTVIVDDRSIITADRSIHASASRAGMDILLVQQGHVELPGYKYGFLGGASGRFMDMIMFTGTIDGHPDRDRIHEFIERRGLKVKILSTGKVLDTGSILVI